MGVHESQSLFWERMIFQSKEFWVWATPIVHKHFPHTVDCTAHDFYEFVNNVSIELFFGFAFAPVFIYCLFITIHFFSHHDYCID